MSEGLQFADPTTERRYRKVAFSGQLVLSLMSQGLEHAARCVEGLPGDATIAGYGHNGHDFFLVFHSPQWEIVADEQEIPDQRMLYEYFEVP